MKEVSKEDWKKFLKEYPNKLTRNTYFISEPPVLCFHDFIKYKGWDALVATYQLNSSGGIYRIKEIEDGC